MVRGEQDATGWGKTPNYLHIHACTHTHTHTRAQGRQAGSTARPQKHTDTARSQRTREDTCLHTKYQGIEPLEGPGKENSVGTHTPLLLTGIGPPQGRGLHILSDEIRLWKKAAKRSFLLDAARRESGRATKPQAGTIRTAQKSHNISPHASAGVWSAETPG